MDLIERQDAIDAVKKCRNESDMPDMWYDGMSCALRCIYQLSSAQPERKRGKWIRQDNKGKPLYGWYQCSECGAVIGGKANFCSECGADMREVDDERPD